MNFQRAARLLCCIAVFQSVGVRAFSVPLTNGVAGAAALKTEVNAAAQSFFGVEGTAAGSIRSAETRRRWRGTPGRRVAGGGRRERTTRATALCMQAGEKNLFDCIREEDLDSLRRYVERGGPVHVADTLGDPSLLVAASTGNVEVLKILCGALDAAVNYPSFHGGETPLMVACTQGQLGVAEFLVKEAGAHVNAVNHRGDTALSLAAFWGKLDCLKLLLSLPSIDTEIQNIQGKRAGEGMQELMRNESQDDETVRLLTESRVAQGITRL
ncbi:unnamed protein product [Pylaiella littoralis]